MGGTIRRTVLVFISVCLLASSIPMIAVGISAGGADLATLASSTVIHADNDTELASLVSTNSWKGTGTMFDPFVIENLKINVTDNPYGIYLGNVSKYLIINNCLVYCENVSWPGFASSAGIALFNVTNSTVRNNTCTGNGNGIYLFNSSGNMVTNNHCSGNGYGLCLNGFSSRGNVISKNNCSGNAVGIQLLIARNNIIIGNDFSGNDRGLYGGSGVELTFSNNNTIGDNICGGKDYGINLFYSSNNSIHGNSCSGKEYGICLEADSHSNQIIENSGTFIDKTGGNSHYDYQAPYDVVPVFIISAILFALVTTYLILGRKKRSE